MAASTRKFALLIRGLSLGYCYSAKPLTRDIIIGSHRQQPRRFLASWTDIFRRSKEGKGEADVEKLEVAVRKVKKIDGPTTVSRLNVLKKKTGVISVRGYSPPPDVEQKVLSVASDVLGHTADTSTKLDDRLVKFQVLTRLMAELDHPIPNTELSTMNSLEDAVTFFSTPVHDRSAYEDLSKLNLPRNLHIQMEPVRFDPDTDTFFEGQTAYPERPTVVSSLKYRRKYKGHSGESRGARSVTEFERQKELQLDRERLGWRRIPSEGEC